jgi:hypothetical protein
MPGKKDHSDEVLWLYPPRADEENHWCKEYGSIRIPRGWVFLPAGDAFITRTAKAMGPYWLAVKAAKGYTRKLGIWVSEKNLEAANRLAQETLEHRAAKRIISRAQREKQEARYQQQFADAVYEYLDFAPGYEKLARKIALRTAERATAVGSERVGRTRKLTLAEKAALAARAYIRHNHTKYEDNLANPELILDPDSYSYDELRFEAAEEVDQFLARHRKQGKPGQPFDL